MNDKRFHLHAAFVAHALHRNKNANIAIFFILTLRHSEYQIKMFFFFLSLCYLAIEIKMRFPLNDITVFRQKFWMNEMKAFLCTLNTFKRHENIPLSIWCWAFFQSRMNFISFFIWTKMIRCHIGLWCTQISIWTLRVLYMKRDSWIDFLLFSFDSNNRKRRKENKMIFRNCECMWASLVSMCTTYCFPRMCGCVWMPFPHKESVQPVLRHYHSSV